MTSDAGRGGGHIPAGYIIGKENTNKLTLQVTIKKLSSIEITGSWLILVNLG